VKRNLPTVHVLPASRSDFILWPGDRHHVADRGDVTLFLEHVGNKNCQIVDTPVQQQRSSLVAVLWYCTAPFLLAVSAPKSPHLQYGGRGSIRFKWFHITAHRDGHAHEQLLTSIAGVIPVSRSILYTQEASLCYVSTTWVYPHSSASVLP
jgi:hypothetical protein